MYINNPMVHAILMCVCVCTLVYNTCVCLQISKFIFNKLLQSSGDFLGYWAYRLNNQSLLLFDEHYS